MNVLEFNQQLFSRRNDRRENDIRRKNVIRIVHFIARNVFTYVSRDLIEC